MTRLANCSRSSLSESEARKLAKRIYGIYDSGIEDPSAIAQINKHAESI